MRSDDYRSLLRGLLTLLNNPSTGVVNGDMLAAQKPTAARRPAPAPAPTGGLDFSNLLAAAPAATSSSTTSTSANPTPVYYPGMSVDDAMMHNPHPRAFVSLLLSKDHLFKGA